MMLSSREPTVTSASRPRPASVPLASYTAPASSQAAMSSSVRNTILYEYDGMSSRRRINAAMPSFPPHESWGGEPNVFAKRR